MKAKGLWTKKGRKPRVRPHIFPNCEEDWEYSEWVGRKDPRGGRLAFEGSASSLAVHSVEPNIKNPAEKWIFVILCIVSKLNSKFVKLTCVIKFGFLKKATFTWNDLPTFQRLSIMQFHNLQYYSCPVLLQVPKFFLPAQMFWAHGLCHRWWYTLIMFYKQRFISNDFLTSLFLKKDKQQTSIFSKN